MHALNGTTLEMLGPSSAQIRRTSLHDQVVGRLREMILDGELAAGERVAEKRLCDLLGISRTPLREALKVLAFEGLVTLRPNRGAVVAPVSHRTVAELFPLCGTLERLAAETACSAGSAAADFAPLVHDLRRACDAEDSQKFRAAAEAFRQRLFAVAGNAMLAGVYHAIARQAMRACASTGALPMERMRRGVEMHERMLDSLSRGDCGEFGRLLQTFRQDIAGHVVEHLVVAEKDAAAGA